MRQPSKQKAFVVTVEFESGKTRDVQIKASSKDVAARRALKHAKGAVSVKEVN